MFRIPILPTNQNLSSNYIQELKEAIKSDGCTGVSDCFQDCCTVHDLGYRFDIDPWGTKVTRKQVDDKFRTCMRNESWLGKLFSRWRYPVVRVLGKFFDKKEVPEFETYIYIECIGEPK